MKLTRLKLVGFKSFVDPAEFLISPGLTGVVGPNGCGKSNLVEALRWVMGESSHKALRASEMEDVIFAGSGGRPARNTAEVTLFLDNSSRLAPAPYTDVEELEVSRRIERDKGSAYRINGRDARARDVQLLFADASTGARSPALVRQGQIAEIIAAKPEQRRRVLEEAAGIAGLHARRHESEIRLRAAEQNLERVEDVLNRMRLQLDGLKRQARQAIRYRQLQSEIRHIEAVLLARQHQDALAEAQAAEAALAEAERKVADCTLRQGEAARAEAVSGHQVPRLREASASANAAVARLRRAVEDLDRDEREARGRLADVVRRIGQLQADLDRERQLSRDAGETLERLSAEEADLADEAEHTADREAEAADRMAQTAAAMTAAEAALSAAEAAYAERSARREALDRALRDLQARASRLMSERDRAAAELDALDRAAPPLPLGEIREAREAAEAILEAAEGAALDAEAMLSMARDQEGAARAAFAEAEAAERRLEVEARTLAKLLNVEAASLWPPVVDSLSVDRGFEAALGAALGDDLDAPLDEAAPIHWRENPGEGDPRLPEGVTPLSSHVRAPAALRRRLAQIGVASAAEARSLQPALKPGQRLVSPQGGLWRWDGFTAAAEAPTAAARRLKERNRLAEVEEALALAAGESQRRNARLAEAQAAQRQAGEAERLARERVRGARQALETARLREAEAEREAARREARRAALAADAERLALDHAEAMESLAAAQDEREALPPVDDLARSRDAARAEAERARAMAADARAAAQALGREREARLRRIEALRRERASWESRAAGADDRLAEIEARRNEAAEEKLALEEVPETAAEKRRELMSLLADAQEVAREAADALAVAERARTDGESAARAALAALGEARTLMAREEARREAARARLAAATHRLAEAAGGLADPRKLSAEEARSTDRLSAELERARIDRERLGAVNLRAEDELNEVQKAHDDLVAERDDLIEAVKRLRTAIQQLNREGRERLAQAFEVVHGHFRELFTALFGGGEARLELIESEDPLQAGLEVVARPPGKRPQTLSLLSGGEQALTAMALIFAIFLTNPAPICVLDEVDAPLDDANVERFCDLLEKMRGDTDTRFLVVTHNPVTMARMDRLFGVTMAERGVSQLVSVDLHEAERLREAS